MLLTIYERGSKIDRNSVYDCHLLPDWRQMAIENNVLTIFDLRTSIVLTFSIAAYLCAGTWFANMIDPPFHSELCHL